MPIQSSRGMQRSATPAEGLNQSSRYLSSHADTRSRNPRGSCEGEFVLLQFVRPGWNPENFAVLLLDPDTDRLYIRSCRDFPSDAASEDAEILQSLVRQFMDDAEAVGGAAVLGAMEDTLSNCVRVTPRTRTPVSDFLSSLDRLYDQHFGLARNPPLVLAASSPR